MPSTPAQEPDAASVHELMDRTFLTSELFDYVRSHCQMHLCPVEVRTKVAEIGMALGDLYQLITQLMPLQAETDGATALRAELEAEKARRSYYQDIVYNVCNQLDRALGGFTVCGSLPSPTTQVQDRLAKLIQERRCYFLEATKSEAGRRDRPATKPPEA